MTNWQGVFTLLVLAFIIAGFIRGKLRSDLIALCALIALMLAGILAPAEALAGFSNPIILVMAGVFVLGGAIVRTGLANAISAKIIALAGTSQNSLFMLVMLVTASIGSLVSNTGTVAIMMPIVVSIAVSINESPSRFLMPLAFMSSMGGMLTLIGNPANMIVNEVYIKEGYETLGLFSFLPVGIISVCFGLFILAPITSRFLARRKNTKKVANNRGLSLADLIHKYNLAHNMYKMEVPPHSVITGKSLAELRFTGVYSVTVHEIRRPKIEYGHFGQTRGERMERMEPGPNTIIQPGDILLASGDHANILAMAEECDLLLEGRLDVESADAIFCSDSFGVCELVLMSSSSLVGRAVADSGLRERFGVSLRGIQRGDEYIVENLHQQTMQAGDALLVQGRWEYIGRLERESTQWVVVGSPTALATANKLQKRSPFVLAVVLFMVVAMTSGLLPTVTAVLLAAVAVVIGGCFRTIEEAYSYISWETLIMVACMLPLAVAMEKTGLVGYAADVVIAVGQSHGPHLALAVMYAMASAMNIVINGTPVALILAPVAIRVAQTLHVDPLVFIVAVATGACMCFASPFSTASNALVMSAGRYTFLDYLKIGLPMQILLGVVMVLVLPLIYSF